ncbi:MAG: SpoIIE family protein phosphatase [Candidatus Aminicenantes bacterium]|nr:SpoIIE family protein phosphatase [Candidatus Aminicenantes bacterium]
MPELYIFPRRGDHFTYTLDKASVCLGRAPDNDLILPDQFCSSCHAMIVAVEGGFVLRDKGSKNGSFVNGQRVEGERPLRAGDEILVGSTRIIFDQKSTSGVNIVEGTPLSTISNTIIGIKDILRKPALPAAATPGRGADLAEMQHEQRVLVVLNQVSQALIYHMPLERLLDHIMDLITQNVPMDRGALLLKEGNPPELQPRVVRVRGDSPESQTIQISRSIVNTALEKNSAILISDVLTDVNFKSQASVIQSRISSAMCVPLYDNRDIIGLVYADRGATAEKFTESDLRLLTVLANVAAVKIENARLIDDAIEKDRMKRELSLAAQIWRNLLPQQDPALPGYDISGRARPSEQIGGDYYDFIPLGDGRLGLVMADVSGAGVSAALLMVSLRASLHGEAEKRGGVSELAARLNQFVFRETGTSVFISFFYSELELRTGELSYVNAGHNPPFIIPAAGEVRRLDSTGFCLGMFADVAFESGRVKLEPGDLLCLYTDGITESRDAAKREFGEEGLVRVLRDAVGRPAEQIVEHVFEEAARFSGGFDPSDDETVVVVKRLREGEKPKKGPGPSAVRRIVLRAELGEMDAVRAFVRKNLEGLGLPEEEAFKVELSVHEVCVNIALYAYPKKKGDIRLSAWRESGRLVVEVRDGGVPFDPGKAPPPKLENYVHAGRRGGLGIYLFRKLLDDFSYRREQGQNVLTLYKDL